MENQVKFSYTDFNREAKEFIDIIKTGTYDEN